MFYIIQSNDPQHLANLLGEQYRHHQGGIFDDFRVITSTRFVGEWLRRSIAKQSRICAAMSSSQWLAHKWILVSQVLNAEKEYYEKQGRYDVGLFVPKGEALSRQIIGWQIFDFLTSEEQNVVRFEQFMADESHPLHFLLSPLVIKGNDEKEIDQKRLWRLCQELSVLYAKYLIQRPDFLLAWASNQEIMIAKMIAKKDELAQFFYGDDDKIKTPDWLIGHYESLERALRFLWHTLFRKVHEHQLKSEKRFWKILQSVKDDQQSLPLSREIQAVLPTNLYLFIVQQLPKSELDFLKKLSNYFNVVLFHYNPSMEFWADIVDKNWLLTQKIIRPNAVYLKEHGHTLLSRLGKSSREAFAMLADMSGGMDFNDDQVIWQDEFIKPTVNSLLNQLKYDILMLDESGVQQNLNDSWLSSLSQKFIKNSPLILSELDDSLVIHNCHSLKRQLEIARLEIGKWLNQDSNRTLSDIAIMLPDIEMHRTLIESMFGDKAGLDDLVLPARLMGVSSQQAAQVWQAVSSFYTLPAGRLYADELYAWLLLPPLYESFGLSFDEMSRACELLQQAGFVRGLDGTHLQNTLDGQDMDYRHSFAFALDRLVLSLSFLSNNQALGGAVGALYPFVWQNSERDFFGEKTSLVPSVSFDDIAIIAMLCEIYQALNRHQSDYHTKKPALEWLDEIENDIIDQYFAKMKYGQSMLTILQTKEQLKEGIYASQAYQEGQMQLSLPLSLVLESWGEAVLMQQSSAMPSSVILVGQFGSLRALPFKLVLMLGMELSAFPRKEKNNRLDLTKAEKSRLGDRHSEDDDNGAFLEALLCAGENCWIFYTGQGTDGQEKLPATPVSELINFIRMNLGELSAVEKEAWLSTHFMKKHAPLPFFESLFVANSEDYVVQSYPPAPLWQKVHTAIKSPKQEFERFDLYSFDWFMNQMQAFLRVDLEQFFDLDDDLVVSLNDMINAIKNPAKTFLKNKIEIYQNDEQITQNELLALDSLQNFHLSQNLLSDTHQDYQQAYFENLPNLPAGVARFGVLSRARVQMIFLQEVLIKNLQEWLGGTEIASFMPQATTMQKFQLNFWHEQQGEREITCRAQLPIFESENDLQIWCNIYPSTPKAYHRFSAFLHHLAWQAVRDSEQENKQTYQGASVWLYGKDKTECYVILAIPKELAQSILCQCVVLTKICHHTPLLYAPKIGEEYVQSYQKDNFSFEKLKQDWQFSDFGRAYEGKNDPYWAYLLNQVDDERWQLTLEQTVSAIAPVLYKVWHQYFFVLKDGQLQSFLK